MEVNLARSLASDSQVASVNGLNCDDLRHVAQVWYEKNRDMTGLQEFVAGFFKGFKDGMTEFHQDLARLPFKLCIVTTPDDFLYNAFKAQGKQPICDFYNLNRQRDDKLPTRLSPDEPVIYHLYGHHKDPSSLVITEEDLIAFLVKLVQNEPRLPDIVRTYLQDKGTTCLFIDCGFKNWYLRVLLKALSLYEHKDMSFALEDSDFFAQSGQHQTVVYFSTVRTIQFKHDTLPEFAGKLREAYEALQTTEESEPSKIGANAPKAFLCYASEDRPLVERLASRLKQKGIDIWQDKQNLRAGDDWDRLLVQVIGKQVHYVVVVQTNAMVSQAEGYFYKEIGEALERQRRMKEGIRFIIPIVVGQLEPVKSLNDLHHISVDVEDNIRDLADAILEDWEVRQGRQIVGAI
ncbi:MAG: toll/interleukin-1 receptor domain-containing protein [Nitrospiraceae bacterium]